MTRVQRFTLIAAILGSTVVFLDATVVNVALPAIADSLDAGLAGQQWVLEAYLLTLVALLLVGGSLGDQYGRRRIFVAGLIGFAATSVLCAIAPSDEFLVAARALQGMAGALLVPGSLALVAAAFEGEARGHAIGTWTAFTGIATVLGPAGGGFLVDQLSWRMIFWVNLPLIAVTLWMTIRHVEESKDPEAVPGIDWLGIALSALGLAGPVFALIEQPTYGWSDPRVLIPLVAGVVLFAAFIAHEARTRHPMLELALFRIRNFWVTNVVTFSVYAGLYASIFLIALFLQQTAGYSALEAGLATTPVSVLLFVLSPRWGKMASGTGPRLPMTIGPITAGAGTLLLLRVGESPDYWTDVFPAILIYGLGLSATVAPLTATVLDSVEERHVGIASGVNNGVARVAGLLAIAVLGAVVAASFASSLEEKVPAALGAEAAEVVDKAEAKPLAVPDTPELPDDEGQAIEDAAAEASTDSFHLGIAIAGLLMIAGGFIAAAGVQNPRRD